MTGYIGTEDLNVLIIVDREARWCSGIERFLGLIDRSMKDLLYCPPPPRCTDVAGPLAPHKAETLWSLKEDVLVFLNSTQCPLLFH